MEGFCRGCLIKYDDPDELLEYTEKNRRLFIYSTGLQVKRNDVFTFQLCKDCYLNMQQSCKFKKLCRLSDKKFKIYLSLKEAGETLDLCSYLKNSDDSFSLRWAGNSTPANQKKDDDNESTCTSIRNFMQDMLQDTEMPDSEARIISQVIEEETDVLDDSLDSHWLQDDLSIATDFRLDFSPFSTPRSVSYDHCYTPKRQSGQTPDVNRFEMLNNLLKSPKAQSNEDNQIEKPIQNKSIDDILSDSLLDNSFGDNFDNNVKTNTINDESEIGKIENNLICEQVDTLTDDQIYQVNSKNYYVDSTFVEQPKTYVEQSVTFVEQPDIFVEQQLTFDGKYVNGNQNDCTDDINMKLNEALQNSENVEEYLLKDILGSPTVYPTTAAPLTPTINDILFGEKLDENSSRDQIRLTMENNDVQVNTALHNLIIDVKINKSELITPHIINKPLDITKDTNIADNSLLIPPENNNPECDSSLKVKEECICDICDKTFKNMKALKQHSAIVHLIKFPKQITTKSTVGFCNFCGKMFTDRRNLIHHIKRHEKQKEIRCDRCGLKFSSESKYKLHRAAHLGLRVETGTKDQATCEICKKTMLKTSLNRHVLRHARKFVGSCEVCGRGYYTLSEQREHMREHTGERPHECEVCGSDFKRKNALVRHMMTHTGETRFICDNCRKGYKNKPTLIQHITSGRCSNFKTTGKLNKIKRRKANVVTILKLQSETDNKQFKCIYCNAAFKTLNYLINHQRRSRACRELLQSSYDPPNIIEIIKPPPCAATVVNNIDIG